MRVLIISTFAVAIAITSGTVYTLTLRGNAGLDPVAAAAAEIPVSTSATLLEREREQMILTASATRLLNMVSTPKLARTPAVIAVPAAIPAAAAAGLPAAAPAAVTAPVAGAAAPNAGPAPNAGTAQSIAYNMLASFGFATSEFSCLDNIWVRESGWVYSAANSSGAYGIPQALPGAKMASAGADWQTNPATQISWGLGYIKSVYGTPCGAWSFWQAHGWY